MAAVTICSDFGAPKIKSTTQFSFQSQRKAMPKNAQTTAQLYSSHMLAKWCSKFSKPGFNSTWTVNFQMFKLVLEKAEEPEMKLPTSAGSSKKQDRGAQGVSGLAFLMIQRMLAIWSLVPLPFLKPTWTSGSSQVTYCWSLAWRILIITLLACAAAAAKALQLCLTLCDPLDGSPSGSTLPGILQTRTLEWVAISFSNAWKWKVKVKSLSRVRLFATPWTTAYQAPPSMGFSRQEYWSGMSAIVQ